MVRLALDYSSPTTKVSDLALDPYGLGVNLSAGYSFLGGLGLGLSLDVYRGRSLSQTYYPPLSTLDIDMLAASQLSNVGLFVNYDQPLGPVILRYSFTAAIGILSWDFGNLPYLSLAGFTPMAGTTTAPNLDPGLGLVWPLGFFSASVLVHYRVPLSNRLPSGAGVSLGMGVHF
jgi:hypothetical protein